VQFFTGAIDKTIPEFNKGTEKCDLTWSDSFVEFKNVLQGHCHAHGNNLYGYGG
jgi:hypothetical protein